MIALAYRDSLPQGTADELDQLVQGLTGMLYQEHNPDGTHKNVTADSITLDKPDLTNGITGAIEIQDEHGRITKLYRTESVGTMIDLLRGILPTVNSSSLITIRVGHGDGTIVSAVRLGTLGVGGGGTGNGIVLVGLDETQPTLFHNWALTSSASNVSPGTRMLISDLNNAESPMSIRWRPGATVYEVMKTTGSLGPTTNTVTLGSALDSSLQGYWDAAYIKALYLGTGAGTTTAQIGAWTDVPYSGGNFTGKSSMTWAVTSGEQISYAYTIVGATMTLAFIIDAATIGGTPSDTLQIAIPGGFSVAGRNIHTVGWGADGNGVVQNSIQIRAIVGNAFVSILKWDTTNWTAGASNYVRGEITFAIA